LTRTKHGANRLALQLERDGIDADAIHGNKTQGARTRALKRFKSNELQVLVATDIASRGLDIEDLPHVVNYDLPHVPEDYVHRIGRTGRAGATGEAVSLVSHEDRPLLAAIERLTSRRIEQRIVAGFEPSTTSQAPAQRHEPQRHERGRQGNGQSRHRNSNGGNRQQQNRGPERQHASQGPGQGQQPRHGHAKPQRPQHSQQQRRPQGQQLAVAEQYEDRQPSPERAGNQAFPGLLGSLGRRIFGRKPG
jgi:ATP-dependent RNA helicase RhlE